VGGFTLDWDALLISLVCSANNKNQTKMNSRKLVFEPEGQPSQSVDFLVSLHKSKNAPIDASKIEKEYTADIMAQLKQHVKSTEMDSWMYSKRHHTTKL